MTKILSCFAFRPGRNKDEDRKGLWKGLEPNGSKGRWEPWRGLGGGLQPALEVAGRDMVWDPAGGALGVFLFWCPSGAPSSP